MRVRISIRWMMVVVALAAVAIGPAYRYARRLRQRSHAYAEAARNSDGASKFYQRRSTATYPSDAEKAYAKKAAAWHAERSARYRRGASRPWLVVAEPNPLPDRRPEPPPLPVTDEEVAAARPIVDLTPYRGEFSPEKYAEIERKLRALGALEDRFERRRAERAKTRAAERATIREETEAILGRNP